MQVQELDDLANWFKRNVLEIQNLDDDVMDQWEYEEALTAEALEQLKQADDEFGLLEYIIGIDGMDAVSYTHLTLPTKA